MSKIQHFLDSILQIIPNQCEPSFKKQEGDFTRNRTFTFSKMILSILYLVGNGKTEGVDIELGQFFQNAKRSQLWSANQAASRSAFSKARTKIDPEVFQSIHQKAYQTTMDLWQDRPGDTWKGYSVFAIDGSKFTLPASDQIRETFDPNSGYDDSGKGHYPQCLVSTLYDVFRRIPVARTIAPIQASERDEALKLIASLPEHGLCLFDRGYPSYQFLRTNMIDYSHRFLMRCPASNTFPAVIKFIESGKAEATVTITPSKKALEKTPLQMRSTLPTLTVRVVRLDNSQEGPSVLITNLMDTQVYSRQDIIDLYYKRWKVESYYLEEKIVLDVEVFHSRTPEGIMQELFAAMIITVIARGIAAFCESVYNLEPQQVQAKNAVIVLANDAALLVPEHPEKALDIFLEMLAMMKRVFYYKPKNPRPSQPRVTKRARNKWIKCRSKLYPS